MAGKLWRIPIHTRALTNTRRKQRNVNGEVLGSSKPLDRPSQTRQKVATLLQGGWRRGTVELEGRLGQNYRHDMAGLLMKSYSEIGSFAHLYHNHGHPCQTHIDTIVHSPLVDSSKYGISGLEFDNKGYYLASVSKSGCLTIHDFETLYCLSNNASSSSSLQCSTEIENKHIMHLSLNKQLDVVRWNITNQDEVGCASTKGGGILIFDIGYISSEPVEILRAKYTVTDHGSGRLGAFSDILFSSNDSSKVLAADTNGWISIWDRRTGIFPCLNLTTISHDFLNSIQIDSEDQTVFGAGVNGMIYIWDLRGGRTSVGFCSNREISNPPFTALKLASEFDKIGSLKAQSEIAPSEIHSILLDPSCPHQLAFHLDDGWSGVLDLYNLSVTHLHCPPPPWLSGSSSPVYHRRKASWLLSYSIYVVGSATENGIYLLDFFPDATSPSHVDFDENRNDQRGCRQNSFLPLSEGITLCATHPLNGTIIAGTKDASLLVLSQKSMASADDC
ncbi:hypothetical protein SAY86_026775 [Trapa natans]|uniref:Transducin/WD40 repeat-like superfamily protein n=1 Tax=Trapa natans TaxID=22666 RepID=A0AAN7KM43_TRANT|nr:hypothetical protein SAY86_026775 [Trapa natans]